MRRFENKVAVVTGGSTGIGLAAARRFHDEGAKLVLFARSEADLAEAKRELGANVLTVAGDAARTEDLGRLYAETERTFGHVDVLFANAGIAEFVPSSEVTSEHYDRLFDTNVRGAFFSAQRAAPLMTRGGAIVFNTSVANVLGAARTSIYAATKAAVRSFARTLANELWAHEIRVNAVSPGPTESTIHAKYAAGMSEHARDEMGKAVFARLRLGRMGKAEEVAAAVAFLASAEAAFIIGQELAVDGGLSAL
jgi:NAD(P)-dependent dehydrogenase (short-subunit alcohol dehydrogenase family)